MPVEAILTNDSAQLKQFRSRATDRGCIVTQANTKTMLMP